MSFLTFLGLACTNPPKPDVITTPLNPDVILLFEIKGESLTEVDGIVCRNLPLPLIEDGTEFQLKFHVTESDPDDGTAKVEVTCRDGSKHSITVSLGQTTDTHCTTPSGRPIKVRLESFQNP